MSGYLIRSDYVFADSRFDQLYGDFAQNTNSVVMASRAIRSIVLEDIEIANDPTGIVRRLVSTRVLLGLSDAVLGTQYPDSSFEKKLIDRHSHAPETKSLLDELQKQKNSQNLFMQMVSEAVGEKDVITKWCFGQRLAFDFDKRAPKREILKQSIARAEINIRAMNEYVLINAGKLLTVIDGTYIQAGVLNGQPIDFGAHEYFAIPTVFGNSARLTHKNTSEAESDNEGLWVSKQEVAFAPSNPNYLTPEKMLYTSNWAHGDLTLFAGNIPDGKVIGDYRDIGSEDAYYPLIFNDIKELGHTAMNLYVKTN